MKKTVFGFICLFLATLLVFSLNACSEKELEEYSAETPNNSSVASSSEQSSSDVNNPSDSSPNSEESADISLDSDTSSEDNSSSINLSVAPPSDTYRYYDEAVDGDLIRNISIQNVTNTLTFPFTVQDMLNAGYGISGAAPEEDVDAGRYLSEGLNMTAPGSSQKVFAVIYNPADKPIPYHECLVTTFATSATTLSVNGVTVGTTTYEDLLTKFGKSNMFQTDSFETEKASGRLIKFVYKASSSSMYQITLSFDIAKQSDDFGSKERCVKYTELTIKIK